MYFLAVDTATNSGGIAVGRNSEVIGSLMAKVPLRYSDQVIYYVDFLLDKLGLDIDQIGCFVAANGPGSFTGLRIGLATVKGFCQSMNKPVVALSTLEALAYRYRDAWNKVAPMVDARRQQVYGAVYESGEKGMQVAQEEVVSSPADWLKELPRSEQYLFVGDAAQMYHQSILAIRPESRFVRSDNCILTELCQLGYWRFTEGGAMDVRELRANYIRPSDAEVGKR